MLKPQSRYRIYGGVSNYLQTAAELLSGSWNQGSGIAELEARVCSHFGVRHAIAMPMARVAISLALKHLIRPGEKVLMSPYTIADVVNVVIAAGGIPCFVDVEPMTGNMSPTKLREKIEEVGSAAGAVLVTHLHGLAAEVEEIKAICDRRGLPLLEDTAQALGATASGRRLGTIGIAGIYSFGTYKNLNSWFGGMLVTSDAMLAAKVRQEMASWPEFSKKRIIGKVFSAASITALGWDPLYQSLVHRLFRHGYVHDVESINRMVAIELDLSRRDHLPDHYRSRMAPGQARLVLRQWPELDRQGRRRIESARRYDSEIQAGESLLKPPAPQRERHVYTYYPLQCSGRRNLLKWLMFFHRDIAAQHLRNTAGLESFKQFYSPCPEAERVANSVILLPTYPAYAAEQIEANIRVINWYEESGRPRFDPREAVRRGPF
jgi:dTDP-4-amino-4,6-dideoxygalactose transaminase